MRWVLKDGHRFITQRRGRKGVHVEGAAGAALGATCIVSQAEV